MKTWYRKISREPDELQGYLPRFNTDEREEPKPQTVASPIIDIIETEEENPRTEKDSQPTYTTSTQTTSTSFKSKNEFKATMLPIYERILSQMGLNTAYAKMLVAQDGLESAWGTKPSGKFNFGGIKGKGSVKRTREVINGKDVYINDSFRDFDSLEDYAKYKISLLNNNRYKAFTGDISGFADRVFRGGYATDPNYAETLKRVIASAKHGGILKFQAGGTGEIRPDNRSWFKRKWDDIATAYNSSSWANSAPASVIAGFTPYGLFHYSASGDEDSARLAVLPGAVGTKEVAKNAVKAAEEGVNLVYRHYGNDISKYFQGALKWLRNARKGSIPAAERLEVPKQISKIRLGNPKHDYAFFKDAKTGETILEISPTAQNPLRSGEKAASKQFLQELVGTKDDFGLRGLSYTEKELFPKKFLSAMTQENSAKDIYSKIMSYKAEAGIRSSFTELTEAEARKIFDIGWDANMFYPTNSMNALQNKETFWKENKDIIVKLFRRVPAILGAGVLGNEVISEKNGGIFKAQKGADTKQWVDSWLSQRKDKLKNNAIDTGILALPGILRNPYFRQMKSLNKYTFKEGDLPKDITGITGHKEKTITVSDGKKDTEVHEWTHATKPYEQIAKVKEIIDTWGLKPGIIKDDYLDNPSEIYSRLMEFRYNNNLDPNHEYTLKEVQELRKKNHSGDYLIRTKNQYYQSNINNPTIPDKDEPIENLIDMNLYKGGEDVLERYSDSAIQRLLNDVAQIPNKQSTINYAKSGLKIPKYQHPADKLMNNTTRQWMQNKNGEYAWAQRHNMPNPEFWSRLRDKNKESIIDWEDSNNTATHKLGYGEIDGKIIVYPEVQKVNGKLIDFTRPPYASNSGIINAYETGNYAVAPTAKIAENFTATYKQEYPGFQDHDIFKNKISRDVYHTKGDKINYVYNKLLASGYNKIQASAILGSLFIEGQLDENKKEVGGNGYGLMQWTDITRKNNLKNFKSPTAKNEFERQVDFLMQELKDPNVWLGQRHLDTFLNAKTIDNATEILAKRFCRPAKGKENMDNRKEVARFYVNQLPEYHLTKKYINLQ